MGDKPLTRPRPRGMHRAPRDGESIVMAWLVAAPALCINAACTTTAVYTHNTELTIIAGIGAIAALYAFVIYQGRMPMGYRSLASRLRWDIINNKDLRPGQKLPSVAQLARTHNTTPTTARRALQVLADEGLVDIIHSRGTYLVGADRLNIRVPQEYPPREKVEWHLLDVANNAQPGDPMPSARALQIAYGTDFETVEEARLDLKRRGVIAPTAYGEYVKI